MLMLLCKVSDKKFLFELNIKKLFSNNLTFFCVICNECISFFALASQELRIKMYTNYSVTAH